ncbi:MAG: hypothetical protein LBS73_01035 [Campylobacteraceae bacterium]|jgi:L-asparagine transporter-like permease|nr:hypothetical protein [Campylobacteraceae bacterium]
MQETITLVFNIAFGAMLLFGLAAFVGLVIALASKEYNSLKKRYSLLNPTYYLFYSVVFFCLVVGLFLEQRFTLLDAAFIVVLIVVLISGIKMRKLSKKEANFTRFKSLLWKKYLCEILVVLAIFLNALGVH